MVGGFLFQCLTCYTLNMYVLNRCKRLKQLALDPLVLSKVGVKTFAVKAERWSDSAHQFLKQCVNAGNREALYTLGMVSVYYICIESFKFLSLKDGQYYIFDP